MKVTPTVPEYEIVAPHEAIIGWKNDPVTRQILDIISAERVGSGVRLGDGETLGDNIVQDTARAVGYIEGLVFLEDLLELRFVVSSVEDSDESEKDTPPVRVIRDRKTA